MSKSRSLVVAAVAAALAGVFVARSDDVDAAAGRPAIAASFGPIQVEGTAPAVFFLALRNTGGADAKLALGDKIELRYGTGGGAGDLLGAGRTMTVDPLPTGLVSQSIAEGGAEVGLRLSATGDVTIPAGSAEVLTFQGMVATPGAAPVAVSFKFAKAAGRAPKALAVPVVKTTPKADVDFYGDGSDGDPTIADGAELQTLRNYRDVIIPAGATVVAPSGATIRCTGRFENRGRIVVREGSPGGGVVNATSNFAAQVYPATVAVERGDALSSPSTPGATNSQPVAGAQGALGLGEAVYSLPLSHYRRGGGGGTGTLGVIGGAGGGLLRVIARGPIVNTGRIEARGSAAVANRSGLLGADGAGGGGGGGGIVILASGTSIENATPTDSGNPATGGIVDVTGGNGGTADFLGGAGGGGGGGLVVFCSPVVVANGTTYLQAGLSGFPRLNPDLPTGEVYWCGGGGGGACVGNGGAGGPVRAGGLVGPAVGEEPPPAAPGQLVRMLADPRTLWR